MSIICPWCTKAVYPLYAPVCTSTKAVYPLCCLTNFCKVGPPETRLEELKPLLGHARTVRSCKSTAQGLVFSLLLVRVPVLARVCLLPLCFLLSLSLL